MIFTDSRYIVLMSEKADGRGWRSKTELLKTLNTQALRLYAELEDALQMTGWLIICKVYSHLLKDNGTAWKEKTHIATIEESREFELRCMMTEDNVKKVLDVLLTADDEQNDVVVGKQKQKQALILFGSTGKSYG